jgi:hypothetical protein
MNATENGANTADIDGAKKAEFAKYWSKKGVALKIDGVKFEIDPNLTAAEEVDMWRDDSRILNELVNAVLMYAPGFAEWISGEWRCTELEMQAEEAENGRKETTG